MSQSLRLAALGDSTSVGIGAGADGGFPVRVGRALKGHGYAVSLLSLAESGATTADLERRQLPGLARAAPDLVTLAIGANDAWRLVPDEAFGAAIGRIADAAAATGAHVVVCNLPDLGLSPAARAAQAWVGVSPAMLTARIRSLNRHFDALAARPRFRLVDLFEHGRRTLVGRPELFAPDGFHPSAAGYDAWAALCLPAALAALAARGA